MEQQQSETTEVSVAPIQQGPPFARSPLFTTTEISQTLIDLISLLTGTAHEAISGLSLTSANYQEAIAILKKRFGNVQQIKAKHMEILMTIEQVTSSHDLKALRKLNDLVESHVRSPSAIGVDSASYGSLLVPVLLN